MKYLSSYWNLRYWIADFGILASLKRWDFFLHSKRGVHDYRILFLRNKLSKSLAQEVLKETPEKHLRWKNKNVFFSRGKLKTKTNWFWAEFCITVFTLLMIKHSHKASVKNYIGFSVVYDFRSVTIQKMCYTVALWFWRPVKAKHCICPTSRHS